MTAEQWERVYRDPAAIVMRVFFVPLLALPVGCLVVPVVMAVHGRPGPWGYVIMPLVAVVLLKLWTLLWRLTRVGIYLGDAGIKVINPRVTVVPWDEVKGVEERPLHAWSGGTVRGDVLWIVRKDGSAVWTLLAKRSPVALVRPRAFAHTVDRLERELRDRSS
ncbi:hypothetical protein ACFXDJ_07165 [Streptomyces sp. NPDC059443]|uniref:hypothetical protein n=1 Tax=unclassified Streptomyces TaxID=2593676 RepID=UPI0036A72CB8